MKKAVFISAFAVVFSCPLWAQVTQINSNQSLELVAPISSVKTIFVSVTNRTLWVSEGTQASTIQLSTTITFDISSYTFGVIGQKLIFAGRTAETGIELYVTDGTPAGTQLVKDILPGPLDSEPYDGVMMNNTLYFTAFTNTEGRELWKTDGTTAGTTLVKDINPGAEGSNYPGAYSPIANGSYFLFAARGTSDGRELWKSDGTTGGTIQLKDINPGADSSNPDFFSNFNNIILFSATTNSQGSEYWRSDGTPEGTFMLKDINPGVGDANVFLIEFFPGTGIYVPFPIMTGFHIFNNKAFFHATDGINSGNLYVTDGTTANTALVKTIIAGPSFPSMMMYNAVNVAGKFIFSVTDANNRAELWQSDGTPGGTALFKSFYLAPSDGSIPLTMKDYTFNAEGFTGELFQGNKFFFIAASLSDGNELWISDGTLPNTVMVKNIGPGNTDGIKDNFSYLYTRDLLYFAADNGTKGIELWRTDGTDAGTTLVKDIHPNAGHSNPAMMLINNSKVFFGANDGDDLDHPDLFVLDGLFLPLPVTFGSFTVSASGADVLLKWETFRELNTRDFTVERSRDAVLFEPVGTVNAAGDGSILRNYSFIDQKALVSNGGVLYYRLAINDKEGKKAYSKVLSIQQKESRWNVRLAGNMPGEELKVLISGSMEAVQVTVCDLSGKFLYKKQFTTTQSPLEIDLPSLPKGVYVLSVAQGTEIKSIRFIR
jgi:ELWxxDGT repeat protein